MSMERYVGIWTNKWADDNHVMVRPIDAGSFEEAKKIAAKNPPRGKYIEPTLALVCHETYASDLISKLLKAILSKKAVR